MLFLLGLWPFNFTEKNEARISPEGGLNIARHGTAYTALPAGKLQGLKQVAIHIDLTTSSDGLDSLEKIFGYLISQGAVNFFLAQWKDGLELRVRTERNAAGMIFGADGVFEKDKRTSCLIVYDGQKLSLYANGALIRRDHRGSLSFSNWSSDYPLVVGTDAGGRSQWRGTMYELAIYDRALSPKEIAAVDSDAAEQKKQQATSHRPQGKSMEPQGKKENGIPDSGFGKKKQENDARPLIHYVFTPENTYETLFRGGKALGVRDLGKGEPADLVIPEQFVPYQRTFLEMPPADLKEYWRDRWDVLVNLIGFIPLGILLVFAAGKKKCPSEGGKQPGADSRQPAATRQENPPLSPFMKGGGRMTGREAVLAVGLAVVVGFGASLAIEVIQVYLPSRHSSLFDVLMNTAGTMIGALAAAWYSRKRDPSCI